MKKVPTVPNLALKVLEIISASEETSFVISKN